MLKWCLQEAKDHNLKDHEYMGGFVLDEMKIQVNCIIFLNKSTYGQRNKDIIFQVQGHMLEIISHLSYPRCL